MIFEDNYNIEIRDIAIDNKATNKAILGYLETIACKHSDVAGYGVLDIPRTNRVWLLLDWKLKVIERPKYGDIINIKTWSKGIEKCYAYRDFEIYNKNDEIIAIASSKWILMDSLNFKLVKSDEKIIASYKQEQRKTFNKEELAKIKEPNNYQKEIEYQVRKIDTDINGHVHNLNYLDIAYEIMPYDIKECQEFENVRITYKKEIKPNSKIKVKYTKENDKNIVVLKDLEQNNIHSIIELW